MTTHRTGPRSGPTPPAPPAARKPISLLPPDAQEKLIVAASFQDPFERLVAIESATDYAKRKYPQFFKE